MLELWKEGRVHWVRVVRLLGAFGCLLGRLRRQIESILELLEEREMCTGVRVVWLLGIPENHLGRIGRFWAPLGSS